MAKAVKTDAASSRSIYNTYNSGSSAPKPRTDYYVPAPELQTLGRPHRKTRKKAAVTVRPAERVAPLAVIGMFAAAVLATFTLYSRVQLNNLNMQIVQTSSQLTVLQEEESALNDEYQQTFDVADIEKTMEAGGKMITPNESQMVYLELSEPDTAETFEATHGILNRIRITLNTVIDFFR